MTFNVYFGCPRRRIRSADKARSLTRDGRIIYVHVRLWLLCAYPRLKPNRKSPLLAGVLIDTRYWYDIIYKVCCTHLKSTSCISSGKMLQHSPFPWLVSWRYTWCREAYHVRHQRCPAVDPTYESFFFPSLKGISKACRLWLGQSSPSWSSSSCISKNSTQLPAFIACFIWWLTQFSRTRRFLSLHNPSSSLHAFQVEWKATSSLSCFVSGTSCINLAECITNCGIRGNLIVKSLLHG